MLPRRGDRFESVYCALTTKFMVIQRPLCRVVSFVQFQILQAPFRCHCALDYYERVRSVPLTAAGPVYYTDQYEIAW
jgi:hypothetical protein